MNKYINYIIIASILLVIDLIWIYSNYKLYAESTEKIQKSPLIFNYKYALLAYIIVIFSVIHIALPLTIVNLDITDSYLNKLFKSLIYGGSVGFVIYSIYNLTSISIYKNYNVNVLILDTLWGTFLYTIITFIYIINMDINLD
jgi:uncharacterized membrane protein